MSELLQHFAYFQTKSVEFVSVLQIILYINKLKKHQMQQFPNLAPNYYFYPPPQPLFINPASFPASPLQERKKS